MTGRGGFHCWLHDLERKIARLCAGRRCCSCWGGVGINYSFGVSELLDQVEQDGYMIHSLNNKFYISIHLELFTDVPHRLLKISVRFVHVTCPFSALCSNLTTR